MEEQKRIFKCIKKTESLFVGFELNEHYALNQSDNGVKYIGPLNLGAMHTIVGYVMEDSPNFHKCFEEITEGYYEPNELSEISERYVPDTVEDVYTDKIWKLFNDANEGHEPMLSMDDCDQINQILKDYASTCNQIKNTR